MIVPAHARLRVSQGVVARSVGDGVVLVHLTTGRCWQLNRVGLDVWNLLPGVPTVAEIVETLSGRFEVPRDELIKDVDELVTSLLSEKLIESDSGQPETSSGS